MSIRAMKLAIDALEMTDSEPGSRSYEREEEAIDALREAIAQAQSTEQEAIDDLSNQLKDKRETYGTRKHN